MDKTLHHLIWWISWMIHSIKGLFSQLPTGWPVDSPSTASDMTYMTHRDTFMSWRPRCKSCCNIIMHHVVFATYATTPPKRPVASSNINPMCHMNRSAVFSEIQTLPSSPPGIPQAGDTFHYKLQRIHFQQLFLNPENLRWKNHLHSTTPECDAPHTSGQDDMGGGSWDPSLVWDEWMMLPGSCCHGHLEGPKMISALELGGLRLKIWPFLVSVSGFLGCTFQETNIYPTKQEKENHGLKSTGW